MPYATTSDNVQLYFEEAGGGPPILFIHEFAADYASWEPQMRYFSRSHRCITYSARGYIPSHIPEADAYSYKHFRDDAIAMLDHLKIPAAHLVGLSMGAYSALQVGIEAPKRALSLTRRRPTNISPTRTNQAIGETQPTEPYSFLFDTPIPLSVRENRHPRA